MLDKEPHLPEGTNVFKFWEERRKQQPELYILMQVALGVPATRQHGEGLLGAEVSFIITAV